MVVNVATTKKEVGARMGVVRGDREREGEGTLGRSSSPLARDKFKLRAARGGAAGPGLTGQSTPHGGQGTTEY